LFLTARSGRRYKRFSIAAEAFPFKLGFATANPSGGGLDQIF
jgi:hypothetical protein